MKCNTDNYSYQLDIIALLILVAVVYGSSLGHDFQSNFDDNWYVLYNDAIRGFSWNNIRAAFTSFYSGHYPPIQILSYMLDYSIWGLAPGGFHLTNLVIHALNGLLIYRLFSKWYGERLFALVGAAFFLVHPVQVEAVGWISQRKSLLSMFFLLLAWECYNRYREAESSRGRLNYVASVSLYALSLSAKAMSIVFPLVLIVYDHCFYNLKRRLCLKNKILFILLALSITAVTIYSQNAEKGLGTGAPAVYHGGSPWATFLTMLPVFCRYLWMLLWPSGLSPEYAPSIHSSIDAPVMAAALLLLMLAVTGVFLYRRDKRLGFWILFFWIALLPVANIVPMIFLMQDHYLYLPMMAVAALAGSAALWLRERLSAVRHKQLYLLFGMLIAAMSVTSFLRLKVWRNDLTLWSDAIVKEPGSYKVWECYGDVMKASGNMKDARMAFERSLKLKPNNPDTLDRLGDLYTEMGELDKGLFLFQKLLEIKPSYVTGWANMGNNYLKRGNFVEAEKAYKRAQLLQPEAWQILELLGNLARIEGKLNDARLYYEKIESRLGNNAENAYNLACVEALAGNTDAALGWLDKALQRGYGDFDKLNSDRQLSSIRNTVGFKNLLQNTELNLNGSK